MDTSSIIVILTLIGTAGLILSTGPNRGGGHTKRHHSGGKKTRKHR